MFGWPVWLILGLCLFPWRRAVPHRQWLLLLLAPPALCGVWGIGFSARPWMPGAAPPWIVAAPYAFLVLALLATLILPFTIGPRFRFASFALGMASLSVTLIASILAILSVTGDVL